MNQLWSRISSLLGNLFLLGGGTATLGLSLAISLGHVTGFALAFLVALLVFFGLVPLTLGAGLLYYSRKARQQALRDHFFQMLHQKQGRISVLDYATANRLEPAIARQFLDGWAREFDATFEVTDAGDIYYIFIQTPTLPENTPLTLLQIAVRRWLQGEPLQRR